MFDRKLLKTLNILYAEDDAEQRDSMEKTLKLLFNNVYMANDGLEALEIFAKHNIQIVLLDYVMPNLNGYETALKIRTKKPYIPIIITSAFSDKEKLLNSIHVQVIDYLDKPIIHDRLMHSMRLAYQKLLKYNLLSIELQDKVVYCYIEKKFMREEEDIKLSKQEIVIIEHLLHNKGQLVLKNDIESLISDEAVEANTLRNIIYRLRKKLGDNNIQTVQDIGYLIP